MVFKFPMEGSDDSGCEVSASSRGLNTCIEPSSSASLENRLVVSRSASDGARSLASTKVEGRVVSSTVNFDYQVGSSGVCGNDGLEMGDVSLRQWLDKPQRTVDVLECMHIFRQIVETVNLAHSQGIVVHNVRPSCFIMSSFSRISFIESASCSSSGSDSLGENALGKDGGGVKHTFSSEDIQQDSRIESEDSAREISSCVRSSSGHISRASSEEEGEATADDGKVEVVDRRKKSFPLKNILLVEMNWYTSPEEATGAPSSFASDVYRLGVLLFELFCTFSSMEEKLGTMANLRHRVLQPQMLLKWPKEASFCLWLLHPQPATRPRMSEVLQSEFLNAPKNNLQEREAAILLKEEIEEKELLLEFLLQLQQRKQDTADKLQETICCLSSDIDEVLKQQAIMRQKVGSYSELDRYEQSAIEKVDQTGTYAWRAEDSFDVGSRQCVRPGLHSQRSDELNTAGSCRSKPHSDSQESFMSKSTRLMKNFRKLESAYLSTRCRLMKATGKQSHRSSVVSSDGRGSISRTEGSSVDNWALKGVRIESKSGWINPFLEGLCKYLSFSKFKVRADLKQGDLLNSSNLVCCLSFDRDKEFFATAGVNRKIKVFECDTILNEERDIHYPVVEMSSKSKLSSICWNSYIKSQIASSDFEGIVQVWDATRGQVFAEMREHDRRVWSVDFSLVEPTKLASGSDDGAVKLWNINQASSIATIRTQAYVCCVQFPPDSARSLVIGSADHNVYCYDLRNTRSPWCTLVSHSRTVSYVKFVDSTTLVSASTDSSLKLWDLTMNVSRVLESPVQTFTGHTNVKNFVGLSVADGYIATGSESNEVYVYHKAFPMPVLSFKFNSMDPLSGLEVDDASQFISSVCWRGQSNTLVAANSSGNIKLLEMA